MSRTDRPVRVLVVEHEPGAPAALLGRWLERAGAQLDVRRPYAGDALPGDLDGHDALPGGLDGHDALPGDLDGHDALVVLGGSMGAHDDADHAWLAPTKALVRRAAEEGVTTLGVCLGHQLAAAALGGRSARNPAGQQLGLLPVGWTRAVHDDALFAAAPGAASRGLHWNDDVVVEQPPGTVVLALAPGGELQVARYAPTVWGLQLHPEVDEAIVRGWHEEDPDRHAAGVVGPVLAGVAEARDELERSWRPVAEQLVRLAASGSQARSGRREPTAGAP